MNAATRVFLKHGVTSTTIDQITAAAKVAKGSFYLHFSSKEDLIRGLRERFIRDFIERIDKELAECAANDWAGKLRIWTSECINGYLDATDLHDIVFHEVRAGREDSTGGSLVFEHLSSLLEAGNKAKAWSVEDPDDAAVFVFSGVHGMVDNALARNKRVNRSRLSERALHFIGHTIRLSTKSAS